MAGYQPRVAGELARSREGITRLTPEQARDAVAAGALLVDTRTERQRREQGELSGAIVIDRTILEWRLDPKSPTRIEEATDAGVQIIVVCAGLQLQLGRGKSAKDRIASRDRHDRRIRSVARGRSALRHRTGRRPHLIRLHRRRGHARQRTSGEADQVCSAASGSKGDTG
jgi:hypothetical protein